MGAIKVGAASPAHIHSRVSMTAALPSLALALLCLLQAGAQVPVQPNLDTEKVSAQGAAWHILPGLEGLAGAEGLCCTSGHLPAPFLSQLQGSFQESLCKIRLVLAAVSSTSSSPTARTPTCGAIVSPSVRQGTWTRCCTCTLSMGQDRVFCMQEGSWSPCLPGWSPQRVAGFYSGLSCSPWWRAGPHRQWQVHCRLANFCSGLPGPPWRCAGPLGRSP